MTTHTFLAKYEAPASALAAGIGQLPSGQQAFAASLLVSATKAKGLSDKQEYWLKQLAAKVATPKAEPAAIDACDDLAGIMNLFQVAKTHLKRPRVVLDLADGRKVKLAPAADHSKNPGHLYVSLQGEYCGKVNPAGGFLPFKLSDADTDAICDLLMAFSADPAGVATVHGKKTGNCCFCSTEITTKESLAVGYGPICAEHFGLPWGEAE